MLTLVALALAAAPELHLVIYTGSTKAEQGATQLAEAKAAAWNKWIFLADGYPRLEESARVPGLKPGFHVVTLGACATEAEASAILERLRSAIKSAGAKAVPYSRATTDGRAAACPLSSADKHLSACRGDSGCATGCQQGEPPACAALIAAAKTLEYGARKSALLESACTARVVEGCELLAITKTGADRDLVSQKACDLGSAKECRSLGDGIGHHLGGIRRTPAELPLAQKAVALWKRACDLGDAQGCYHLGDVHSDDSLYFRNMHELIGTDHKVAASAFEKACTKDPSLCVPFGNALAKGRGVAKDEKRALELFVAACALPRGDQGCYWAGQAFSTGLGTKKNLTRAKELYRAGCDKECDSCCEELGIGRPEGD